MRVEDNLLSVGRHRKEVVSMKVEDILAATVEEERLI